MKILAVGFNYPCHQAEANSSLFTEKDRYTQSDELVFFHKGDSLLRPNTPFFIPEWSQQIDYEAEIVVQIDRVGKYISERFAHRYYSKLSIGIDLTARDLQREAIRLGRPWTASKAFDNSAVVGSWIDKNDLNYPNEAIRLKLLRNGEIVQEALSSNMLHSIDKIIAHISERHTLKMGDIIFTGTPSGIGKCEIGQHFEGYLNEYKLLELDIR